MITLRRCSANPTQFTIRRKQIKDLSFNFLITDLLAFRIYLRFPAILARMGFSIATCVNASTMPGVSPFLFPARGSSYRPPLLTGGGPCHYREELSQVLILQRFRSYDST